VKKVALGFHALVLSLAFAPPAIASSITGDIAIGGVNTYTLTDVDFHNHMGFVFMADGNLAVLNTFPLVMMSDITFATAAGELLFDWNHGGTEITLTILNLIVDKNNSKFLNTHGTATVTETGFDPTRFDISLTSTRGGLTDYALTVSPIPEPGSLLLVGSGLVGFAGLLFRRLKKPAQHC
jgi:hypothetical protein